ncbi:hypothetical protein [Microcoleus vaginatus]
MNSSNTLNSRGFTNRYLQRSLPDCKAELTRRQHRQARILLLNLFG